MNKPNGRAARPAYVRPMNGWWRRDPYFLVYMAREATASRGLSALPLNWTCT